MLVNVEMLKVWKLDDVCKYFTDVVEGGVLKFDGEGEFVEKVKVVDGKFEVKSEDDIRDWLKDGYDEYEGYDEFVRSEVEEWFEIDGEMMNVYGENYEEEFGYFDEESKTDHG